MMTMLTVTLNNYIQTVERMYRLFEGEELSRLLSLRDAHVANKNLRSSDIASLVEGNCVAPLDEVIICHLLCVKDNTGDKYSFESWDLAYKRLRLTSKVLSLLYAHQNLDFQALYDKEYMEAYSHQSQCVVAIVKILQNLKEQNWCLPLMYTACLDLRLVAQKAEAFTAQSEGKILEKAAESLLSCFRVCAADNRTSDEETKRLGMLYLVNQLLKVYFRINKLHLCKPLIRAIDSSPLWHQFPLAQQITYRYFVGRKAMFDSEYSAADDYLSFAFQKCHRKSHKNKRLILTYLIPVKMLLGYMPTADLLEKYDLLQFLDLISVVKNGDLRGIDRIMEQHESFFISAGIYLIVEKLKIIAYRNLFRKVYLVENNHQIDIASFQAALQMMGQEDVDSDETQCIVANLIFQGKIKGYISYQHKKVVVSKQNAFPPLSSL